MTQQSASSKHCGANSQNHLKPEEGRGERVHRNKDDWKKEARKQRLSLQVSTIRRAKGISVSELAERAGYEPSTIRKIENGNHLPDKDKDISLANALGISLNQLWGRRKFELYDNGQPKLTEMDKTALTLIAPMLKAMSKEGRARVIDIAITTLLAEGAEAAWEEYSRQKE